jgi:hypothetical protein
VKSLRFPYVQFNVGHALWSLDGRTERPRAVFSATLVGPTGASSQDSLLDTGADDTVFPLKLAGQLGIDLANAPTGTLGGIGGTVGAVLFALVTLRITDGKEFCEWPARVGFTAAPLKRPLLGFAGFLQFFRAVFDGDLEEVELTTNRRYPGT